MKEKLEDLIYVKNIFFEQIESGEKTLELRIGFSSFKNIEVGDSITFSNGNNEIVDVEITAIRAYNSLPEIFDNEDLSKLVPGMSKTQINTAASNIFKESDISKNGLLIFEFEKIG